MRMLILGAALLAALIAAAPASAACKPKHAHIVAKYGAPVSIYACTKGLKRAKRIQRFESGTEPTYAHLRAAGHYVAFALTLTDVVCTKYDPENPACVSRRIVSFDMRTGKRRALADTGSSSLVLVPRGWVAWREGTAIKAVDSHGVRTLDPGPASALRAAGNVVSWTNGTERRQATLR
jgi:hypothetical protein